MKTLFLEQGERGKCFLQSRVEENLGKHNFEEQGGGEFGKTSF